jgi:hypothetical protein
VRRVPKPSDIDGDWEGTLAGAGLRIVLHIVTYEDGMSATIDSPGSEGVGAPRQLHHPHGTKVAVHDEAGRRRIQRESRRRLAVIDGTWSQLGNSLPLVLKRVKR